MHVKSVVATSASAERSVQTGGRLHNAFVQDRFAVPVHKEFVQDISTVDYLDVVR